MPLTPDYQSATDRTAEERGKPTSLGVWLATLALFASVGALLKGLLITNGILPEEKPAVVVLLIAASALVMASFAVNVRSGAWGAVVVTVLCAAALGGAYISSIQAWR